VKNRQAKRTIHNPRFPKALEVHEDLLESLSSLVSNEISSKYFGLPNVKVNSLLGAGYWYNFSFNIVPSARVLWCMLYMVGEIIKLAFQCNKWNTF
jgi:hypothetical protein